MTNTAPPSQQQQHSSVVPSEVGWQFVPQYYTFVNKQPNRLHCFYTKNSTFIHGTEGEDGRPCYGQQEIHNKILSIGFQDCKVFIHSVDAQASANNGIIIQVIGEMSNRGEAWRKFVQTFFLAEQPNGYFVLNDIFRFLKEESVDEEEEGEPAAGLDVEHEHAHAHAHAHAPAVTVEQQHHVQQEPLTSSSPAPVVPVHDRPTVDIASDHSAPSDAARSPTPDQQQQHKAQPNGYHAEPEKVADVKIEEDVAAVETPAPAPVSPVVEAEPEPVRAVTPPPAPSPAPPAPAPAAKAASPAPPAPAPPSQTQAPPPPQQQQQHQAPPPQPVAAPTPATPPQPKTWANLAAANSKKWGAAVAQESRGLSETVAQPSPATAGGGGGGAGPGPGQGQGVGGGGGGGASSSAPGSGRHTPVGGPGGAQGRGGGGGGGQGGQHHRGEREQHPALVAAMTHTNPQVFLKGVTEIVPDQTLRTVLTTRFGPLKELEIVRSKACAFLEFTNIADARRALAVSLPQSQGGEGGIRVEVPEGLVRVVVEVRKERSERVQHQHGKRGGGAGGAGGGGGGGPNGEARGGYHGGENRDNRGGYRGGGGRGAGGGGGQGRGAGGGGGRGGAPPPGK
ncbi:hypothetical protein BD410DRAFT_816793 [Rickenella mellea]|uniref:NTF2-domain-containing protein n=1 Tax=Rickenella mellea TaxID=50990 RepID=A0A4Y7PMC9_9AGAM|nr:hypothetical protein BD410DRAFT_816793 [Rickenella mellea]